MNKAGVCAEEDDHGRGCEGLCEGMGGSWASGLQKEGCLRSGRRVGCMCMRGMSQLQMTPFSNFSGTSAMEQILGNE